MLAKKCLFMGIITVLSVSLAIADPPAIHPVTGEELVIDCLRGTPDAIDGDLSDWNLEAMTPAVLDAVEQLSSGQDIWENVGDCGGAFYMLWDDENIYIAAVVTDDKLSMNKTDGNIWNADCVEVLFSTTVAEAAHSWTNPTIHYQYGFNANNQKWNWCSMDGPGQSEPDYLQIVSSVTADGYILEASIEYGQMPSLDFSAGNTIGFHPCIDDTDIDNGDTEFQMSWTGLPAHDQSLGFGHMILSADAAPEPEPAPTIAWISYHAADDEPSGDAAAAGFTEASDIGYTDLLKANGYNVIRIVTSNSPDVELLNTMDLVIISRSASSGHYSGSGATLWNSVTAPVIVTCGYKLRSSRMGYTDGTTMVDTTGDVSLAVTDPDHPIFAGIALTDGVMDNLYAEGAVPLPTDGTISRGVSINNNNIDDEGTVLATVATVDDPTFGGMVIAEYPAGATMENSSGSPNDVLGGPRLVFLTGSREPSGVTSHVAALYDLYEDGTQMFLNAVKYMIPVTPVDPGSEGLLALWTCDEGEGAVVADVSGNGRDGTFVFGDPAWVEGIHGSAIELVGPTLVGIPPLDMELTEATMAGWIKPYGPQPDWSSFIMTRQPGLATGFNVLGYQLAYHWNDTSDSWSFRGGDMIAEDDWTFAAVTIEPDKATFYVNGEAGSVNEVSHGPCMWDSYVYLGGDGTIGWVSCRMIGALDDVLIYDRALSDGEIAYLAGYRADTDDADPSLSIYYTFDEVSDIVADQSGKGHDGVVVGDISAAEGILAGAGKFATGSYLDLDGPSIPAEDIPTSAMTLAAWIQCENTGGDHEIFSARASDSTWLIHPEPKSSGDIRWLLRSYGGTTIFQIRAGTMTWGEWLHFAGTYDKASAKAALYINNELIQEMDVENPADIAGDWGLGARVGLTIDDARPFTGLMDEFRMYTRALSQDEIAGLYSAVLA